MPNAVTLIQARYGSSRLPGKVLLPLGGRPALAHVIERCRAAAGVDRVVVATTTAAADDELAARAPAWGADVFRGSEEDVLGRFAAAARLFPAAHYVRVTADCPFLDPGILAEVLATHAAGGYDFSYNDVPRGFPRGYDVEVMTAGTLAWLDENRRDEASREHVTPYLWEHPPGFKIYVMRGPDDVDYSATRLTLDETADYELLRAVYERLAVRPFFGLADVLALLAREPDLAVLNRFVRQKEAS